MSTRPDSLRCRIIQAEEGYLPGPATKLIVTQYLRASQSPPGWAWIIVGAFFNENNEIIWSTEVFAGHLDIEFESDEEESEYSAESSTASSWRSSSEEEEEDEEDSASDAYSSDEVQSPSHRDNRDERLGDGDYDQRFERDFHRQQRQQQPPQRQLPPPPRGLRIPTSYAVSNWQIPPTTWDPTRQGQVPGYWQASFDPELHRWVHTWQGFC